MKNLLPIIVLLSFSTLSPAQISETDHLVMLSGEVLSVEISEITEREVTFSYPNEDINFTKSKNVISEIVYSSGRRERVADRITIKGEDDWEKVILTDIPADVEGLTKKGELFVKSTATTVFSGSAKIDAKSTKKIKKEAAKLGAHIVFLQTQNFDKGFRKTNRSTKSGIAYGYR
ncbi:MAG: hypothetical protein ACR2MX_19300 [Cyclobacteriaceae bacterium]